MSKEDTAGAHPGKGSRFTGCGCVETANLIHCMRVLIVRLGAFGDIVHTLPLASDLAQAGHKVWWLCEDRWATLLEGSPAVARVLTLPRRQLRQGSLRERCRAIIAVTAQVRAVQADAVIDGQGLAKSGLLAWASGAALRIAHARPRGRELSWAMADRTVPTTAVHVIDQQRALATALDLSPSGDWQFPLPAWQDGHRWAASWLAEHQLVRPWLLNVGAGWPTKVWPIERQVEFLISARQQGRSTVVLWGSPTEHRVAQQIVAASHATGAAAGIRENSIVLAPSTTISQAAGLIAAAGVLVSGDTGPLHLGLALGTPTIGLFGPVPAQRNGPRGLGHRTFQAPGAAWERRDVTKVDMGAIVAIEVVAAAAAAQREAEQLADRQRVASGRVDATLEPR